MEMVAQWKSARPTVWRLGVQVSLISTPMGAVAQWKSGGLINSGGGSNPPSPHLFVGNRQLLGILPLKFDFPSFPHFMGAVAQWRSMGPNPKVGGSTPPSLHTFTRKR